MSKLIELEDDTYHLPISKIGQHSDGWWISGASQNGRPDLIDTFKATCGAKQLSGSMSNGIIYASDVLAFEEFRDKFLIKET